MATGQFTWLLHISPSLYSIIFFFKTFFHHINLLIPQKSQLSFSLHLLLSTTIFWDIQVAGEAGVMSSSAVLGRPPGRLMATHPRILAWEIPWTEEPGGLQSLGSRRVRHFSTAPFALTHEAFLLYSHIIYNSHFIHSSVINQEGYSNYNVS